MFQLMAYGFVGFTAMMVLALLWMGWEHRRDEAKAGRAKLSPPTISN
jgi:hypothetical protein